VDRSQLFSAKIDKFGSISRKVHGIGVLDAEGILFIDYLEKGKKITEEYYSNLLTTLDKKFVRKVQVCKRKTSSLIRTMHPPTKVFW